MIARAGGNDNSKEAYRFVKEAGWDSIRRVTVFFWNEVQKVLNVSNPRPYKDSAKKGEPPRKRTGFGAGNVVYELDKAALKGRVGLLPNAKYMLFHELKDHPWLMITLKRLWPQLQEIVKRGK